MKQKSAIDVYVIMICIENNIFIVMMNTFLILIFLL